jgi:uncharacterized protein
MQPALSINHGEKVVVQLINLRANSLVSATSDSVILNPSCEVMVTSRCNMNCRYCIANDLLKEDISIHTGHEAIDCFIHLSEGAEVLDFSFTGGEPTLDFSVLENLIDYAVLKTNEKGMGARISIKTNGTLLNEAHYEILKKYKCTVFISVDGSETDNNAFRVLLGKNSYGMVIETVKALLANDISVVASMTVHPEAAKNVIQGVKNLVDLGLTRINIAPVYGTVQWDDECVNDFIDSLVLVAQWIKQNKENIENLDIGPIYSNSEHHSKKFQGAWGCSAGSSNIAFLPNGDICGCSSLAMISSKRTDLVLGSAAYGVDQAKLDNFIEIVNGNIMCRDKCRDCSSSMNCTGGCLAINYSSNDSPFSPPDIYCRTISSIEDLWNIAWGENDTLVELRGK